MVPPDPSPRDLLLQGLSVLFVDDDEVVRAQGQGYLAAKVKALHLANDGQEGMFSFALNRPDVVVLDVNMPGMGGLELAGAIRGISPDVPLVLLTGLDDASVFRQAIALGVTDYLSKPLEPTFLLDSLARAASTLNLKRELTRQIKLNELMLHAAPSPSVLVELDGGRVVACNQLAADLGYVAGGNCAGDALPAILEELRRGGEGLIAAKSSREICSHGRHWVLHWAPVGHGTILFTAVDITQRVKIEHFRDDVERIARHDLKTPLSAFTAVPELLLESDNLTEEQREFIRLIRDAGTRMLGMINLSLDLFKMESGTFVLPDTSFDCIELVHQAIRSSIGMARSLGVELRMEAPEGRAPVLVQGDDLLCLSMLGNLIKNALEASPQGGSVDVCVSGGLAPEVRISNQGEVPLAMRERFFQKYTTSGKRSGSGLGTYSAQMVARAHGGDVLVDTTRPGETTVRVLLPPAP